MKAQLLSLQALPSRLLINCFSFCFHFIPFLPLCNPSPLPQELDSQHVLPFRQYSQEKPSPGEARVSPALLGYPV